MSSKLAQLRDEDARNWGLVDKRSVDVQLNLSTAVREAPAAQVMPVLGVARRIDGFDIARSLAILSMLLAHCGQVLGTEGRWGPAFYQHCDGRASAIFVMLAGVGVSLLGRRRSPAEVRRTLLRRGALLFAIGLVNQAMWPGDILRVFGVSLMLAGLLHVLRPSQLLCASAILVLAFPALMVPFDYYARWDTDMAHYRGLWTPVGMLRNLFFDGYRPVIPWAGILTLGMWVGRLDGSKPAVQWRLLAIGLALTIVVEFSSPVLLAYLTARPEIWSGGTIRDWLEISSTPPLPLFILSVTGTALAVTGAALMIGARWAGAKPVRGLVATGQMSLTWYCGHLLILATFAHATGWHHHGSAARAIIVGTLGFIAIVCFSTAFMRRWKHGPMEWLLRQVG